MKLNLSTTYLDCIVYQIHSSVDARKFNSTVSPSSKFQITGRYGHLKQKNYFSIPQFLSMIIPSIPLLVPHQVLTIFLKN